MSEQIAPANGIEIAYQTFGERSDPALLLVMGLGAQLIHWPEEFCELLAARGFYVIRFDNRDIGHSTKIDDAPVPDLIALAAGDASAARYTLDDMADDAVGLLDHLEIDAAHVAGASMGGMIAQTLAIRHPQRVLSICSIMSTTGNPDVGQARPEALVAAHDPGADRSRRLHRLPRQGVQDDRLAGLSVRRGVPALAWRRDLRPLVLSRTGPGASSPRSSLRETAPRRSAQISAPTVVIHGSDDPLITVSGGEATARAIPGRGARRDRRAWATTCRRGPGHRSIDAICSNAARAGAAVESQTT